jgi:amino acid permease
MENNMQNASGSKLTVWEAACIITGYGIGGGVMAMPYLAARNGVVVSLLILIVAYFASLLMHLMVADLSLRAGSGQIIVVFERFLFRGKFKKVLTIIFFGMITVVLFTTLATYITGAGEIISAHLNISPFLSRLIFYAAAASVVVFGLKAVGISEKIAVFFIFVLIAVFAIASFLNIKNPLPLAPGGWKEALAYFGMAMFSFVAFFSVPQAVDGLGGDVKKIHKALFIGFLNIFIMIFIIVLCALLSSTEITPLAMIGWSTGIGPWAQLVGAMFTLLAMITTYWSISLALADILREQTKLNRFVCWLIATIPTLLLTLLGQGGFMEFVRFAGGLNAILISILLVPTFLGANREGPTLLMGRFAALPVLILVILTYILMAIGSAVQL